MFRVSFAMILVGLLASCPIACGTAHASSCAHGGERHREDHRDRSDLPAPANDDDCLCNGAIKAADSTGSYGSFPLGDWIDALPPEVSAFGSVGLTCKAIEPPPPRVRSSDLRRVILRC